MIATEEDYWTAPDGTRYEVGDKIDVLRINGLVLFNEVIIKGSCDMCDWACIAPTFMLYQASVAHVDTHIIQELDQQMNMFPKDWKDHPDFKE